MYGFGIALEPVLFNEILQFQTNFQQLTFFLRKLKYYVGSWETHREELHMHTHTHTENTAVLEGVSEKGNCQDEFCLKGPLEDVLQPQPGGGDLKK